MQLKLRQVLLYFIACTILYLSELPGGSLLALILLLQLCLLVKQLPFTLQSQWAMLKLFILTIPLFFFWGGAHSFVYIYLHESSWLMAVSASTISIGLTFILSCQLILSIDYLPKNDFKINRTLQASFTEIKQHRLFLLRSSSLLYFFSYVPWLREDWKLVFAFTATMAYLNRAELKRALVASAP